MAKKKIDDPLFLQFANLPIFQFENLPIDDTDIEIWFENRCTPKGRARVKSLLMQLLKKDNLPQNQFVMLKRALDCFDDYDTNYILDIVRIWETLVIPLRQQSPFDSGEPRESKYGPNELRIEGMVSEFSTFVNMEPVLYWEGKGYEVKFEPTERPYFGINISSVDETPVPDLIGIITADYTNFLINHYRDGIFIRCKLRGCHRIILTTNGRKYCSRSHVQKASREKAKNNKNKYLYNKERERLRKKYLRHRYKDKWDREEFIRKNWNKNISHLYRPPQK